MAAPLVAALLTGVVVAAGIMLLGSEDTVATSPGCLPNIPRTARRDAPIEVAMPRPVGPASVAGYTDKQIAIARIAIEVGRQRGMPELGVTAALLAAAAESDFQNYANSTVPESLRYDHDIVGSDYDSVGPWQLRASIWGSVGMAQLMNPRYQANWFYDQLGKLPGWQQMPAAEIAQAVERSAVPSAYGRHAERVTQLLAALGNGTRAMRVGCVNSVTDGFGQRVLDAAHRWIGWPYVWGGGDEAGPTGGGFDCSGLTLHAIYVASEGRIRLPHYTQSQLAHPDALEVPLGQQRPGDLIFFTAPEQADSHHVAIYAGIIDGVESVLHAATFGVPVVYAPLAQWSKERWDIRRYGAGDEAVAAQAAGQRAPGPGH
ncbi:NlpC/P60 family protein [Nocardia tenerifensis]|uniref:NlpC/P60 family protein n=1 Tax=Nocardia tenerifensis TaxID=228006 RepID=A0A318JNU5_9NOCA|nr:C40 family peptidase [Nocardia tenerifensis]PXX53452.1 NlpC/P60 family protein [Nocardia tenerifensis]